MTCSCSGSVLPEDFANMLLGVATKSGRMIQVLEQAALPTTPWTSLALRPITSSASSAGSREKAERAYCVFKAKNWGRGK